jgi:flagellar hook-length control protein FliK
LTAKSEKDSSGKNSFSEMLSSKQLEGVPESSAESAGPGQPISVEQEDTAKLDSLPQSSTAKEDVLSVMQQIVPLDNASRDPGAKDDLSLEGSIASADVGLVIPTTTESVVELGVLTPPVTSEAQGLNDKDISNTLLSEATISTQTEQASEAIDALLVQNAAVSQHATSIVSQTGVQMGSGVSSAASNSVTSWGGQSNVAAGGITTGDIQVSQGASQQGQTFSQGGQSGQSAQQQAMMFGQALKEHATQSIEQQAAVKAIDESVLKSEAKDLLGGAEIASSNRRGPLPMGLQAISQPVKHPQWGQALGQRVVFMANSNIQQAQITLNPEKLGHIQVSLKLDKDQQVHVALTAQNALTRESMESALPKLREMFEQAGITLGSMDISDQKQFSEKEAKQFVSEKAHSNQPFEGESIVEDPLSTVKTTDNIVDYYA